MRTEIRDNHGRVIGYIEGNRAYDKHSRFLGRYDESQDRTCNDLDQVVGYGNQLSRLVIEAVS